MSEQVLTSFLCHTTQFPHLSQFTTTIFSALTLTWQSNCLHDGRGSPDLIRTGSLTCVVEIQLHEFISYFSPELKSRLIHRIGQANCIFGEPAPRVCRPVAKMVSELHR